MSIAIPIGPALGTVPGARHLPAVEGDSRRAGGFAVDDYRPPHRVMHCATILGAAPY